MYRWVDHTAEFELSIDAAGEAEVFADALSALAELLGPAAPTGVERRELAVNAPDRPALLAAWLEELVFMSESEGFVATAVESFELVRETAVRAVVTGVTGEPPPLVKAVTYHRLAFEAAGGRYLANVVLDV